MVTLGVPVIVGSAPDNSIVRAATSMFAEVETESHNTERDVFFRFPGRTNLEPMPAPRFSRSELSVPTPPGVPGADTDAVVRDWS